MRFSYYVNPPTAGPDDDARAIREVLGQIDLAESLGFSDVWLTEHHFTGYNAYSDPVPLAAAVSQRNPSMRIGFAVNVVPIRHPIRFVTQCNLLDQLTNGKLIVGVGPGNSPDEFAGFGVDVEKRHDVMEEFLEVCDAAWAAPDGEGFTYSGTYFNGRVRGRVIPAPVQRPRPLVAYASMTPERLVRAGRRGWSLLLGPQKPEIIAARLHHYFGGMDEAGLDEAARARAWGDVSVLRQIYVAEEGEDWRHTIADVVDAYVHQSALANSGIDDLPREQFDERKEQYLTGGWLHAGTADEVFELLRPFAELGISNLMCWMNFGLMSDLRIRASTERFAQRVLPRLQAVEPDPTLLGSLVERNATLETRPQVPI